MKPILIYLAEMLFCSGVLLVFYRLLLVRRVSFRACRRFLMASLWFSALLPVLDIPLYPAPEYAAVASPRVEFAGEAMADALSVTTVWAAANVPAATGGPTGRSAHWLPGHALLLRGLPILYGTVAALSFIRLAIRLLYLRRLRRRSRLTPCAGYTLAENAEIAAPFSFLHTVFLGPGYEGERRHMVLCHEAGHIRHHHSVENLTAELFRCLFWFNPCVWIAQQWLREVHEWEADREVLDAGYDLTRYRIVLFHQLFGYNPDIACGLNHSFTKNRFAMMTQFKKRRYTALRFGAALPVVAGLMMICSFTTRTPEPPAEDTVSTNPHLIEVQITGSDSLRVDGQPVAPDELTELIAARRAALPETERALLTVTLRADEGARMGAVSSLKHMLREAKALRVRYATETNAAERMLPPAPVASNSKVQIDTTFPYERIPGNEKYPDTYRLKIPARNYFMVSINARGELMIGTSGSQELATLGDLKSRARDFLLNPTDNPALSEQLRQEMVLPDGRTVNYAASQGFFGIAVQSQTPYALYVDVQQRLSEVYAELRDDLAREWFGNTCDALDEAQRRAVQRALPMRISEFTHPNKKEVAIFQIPSGSVTPQQR